MFAVAFHGHVPHLVWALRHARSRGITTVCLTAAPGSPAARAADITLVMWGPDTHTAPEQFVSRVLAVGADGLAAELAEAGYDVIVPHDAVPAAYDGAPLDRPVDAVVVGLDREITYRRIAAAVTAVRQGARFIATNADARYPTPAGFLPGAGSVVAAIATAAGVEPLVIGKPSPAMFLSILEASGVAPDEALVVGDNPDADIVAARRSGMRSVLVLTGVTDAAAAAELDGDRRPDAVLPSIADLPGAIHASRIS